MTKPNGSKGRGRSRNNNSKRSLGRSNNHDSQIGRNRGNAQQMMDKYLSLARDSVSQGDRISAENFFQHADHFQRVVAEKNEKQENRRRLNQQTNGEHNSNNVEKKTSNNSESVASLENNIPKQNSKDSPSDLSLSSGKIDESKNTKTALTSNSNLENSQSKSLPNMESVEVFKTENEVSSPEATIKSNK